MIAPPFRERQFDLVWSQGAIYIMGMPNGLRARRRLMRPGGLAAISDISWFDDNPAPEVKQFWEAGTQLD
jgi:hypothetical protein